MALTANDLLPILPTKELSLDWDLAFSDVVSEKRFNPTGRILLCRPASHQVRDRLF